MTDQPMIDLLRALSLSGAFAVLTTAGTTTAGTTTAGLTDFAAHATNGESRVVDVRRAMVALQKEHPSGTGQKKLFEATLAEVARSLPWFGATPVPETDRYFPSLAAAAASLATPRPVIANPFGTLHFAGAVDDAPLDPQTLRYEFGSRGIRILKQGAPQKSKSSLVASADLKQLSTIDRLAWLSEGMSPDAELVLAALERDLDVDRGADSLFAYLDVWRNNDESFYEALDRTAGSPEGIFQYDSMLDRYADEFLTKEDKKSKDFLARGRDAAHDRFHESFLTSRKYRGLVEAVAYSLLLPPDVALPARLSRYDFSSVQGTSLSVRDQVLILLADADGDVAKVVEFITKVITENPLPATLFSTEAYDPVSALASAVIARVEVPEVVKRNWTKEWKGDPTTFNRHYDIAIAYREFRTARATGLRTAVKAHLGSS